MSKHSMRAASKHIIAPLWLGIWFRIWLSPWLACSGRGPELGGWIPLVVPFSTTSFGLGTSSWCAFPPAPPRGGCPPPKWDQNRAKRAKVTSTSHQWPLHASTGPPARSDTLCDRLDMRGTPLEPRSTPHAPPTARLALFWAMAGNVRAPLGVHNVENQTVATSRLDRSNCKWVGTLSPLHSPL